MSIHIERYLCEGVEFEKDINHITVDICSFSPSTTNTALALDTSNIAYQHADGPLPSIEWCGLHQDRLGSLTSEVAAPAAPPLSNGMWVG